MKHYDSIAKEKWHAFNLSEVYQELQSSENGLNTKEAQNRLSFYGPNKLPEGKKVTIWHIILHQLLNPLIFILIAAAIISIVIGEAKDAIFIFIVIFINTALGSYQEYNAEKSAASLQRLMKIKARVLRDNEEIEIEAEELVPGDIVFLESGMKVPSDLRLIEVLGLEIDESFLTGESIAAKKQTKTLQENLNVSDRTNMAFAGSTVIKGRGKGIVVCTGANTQVGKISQDVIESESAKPPLIIRMEKFIKHITVFIIALSVILGIILRMQGMDWAAIFFFVVALAVSAIPEGLPVALTVALSIATRRMAKRNVIVRRLTAVESLGSCTVIASDKTGTLTVNQQTAKLIVLPNNNQYTVEGEGYNGEGKVVDAENRTVSFNENTEIDRITRIAYAANEASLIKENHQWKHHGDAMDVALLAMVFKLNAIPDKCKAELNIIGKIPYESERKFSAAFCQMNGSVYIGLKGAVETILEFSNHMSVDGNIVPIDKEHIIQQSTNLSKAGYRVLAFAGGEYPNFVHKEVYEKEDIPQLIFYGLVAFIDPLRPEAKASVQQCHEAGIKVIMITGDHPETAATIARELGIADEKTPVVTGQMLIDAGAHDSPAYEHLVASTTVFARVTPTQKLEIVDVLIRKGEFVAVTGDGVNDAPALKRANIGVAMGSGTDVAKEVGNMIVVDDNFSSIVAGIEEGRYAYDNVRKVTYLLISTGASQIIFILASIMVGLPLPLLAVQLLWLNLVTNGIQDVALAFEKGEPGAMKRKPRKTTESIFDKLMIEQTLIAGFTIGIIVFGFWYYLMEILQVDEFSARNLTLLLMVFMQNFHVFNSRSERISAFKVPLKNNIILIFGVLLAQGIHIISMQIPFMQKALNIEPISSKEWVLVLLLAIPIILIMELYKWLNRNKL